MSPHQPSRSGTKRFYDAAWAEADGGEWRVVLDGRPVMTPMRARLHLPSRPLAKAIAAEWDAQGAKVMPETMPLTRLANAAVDRAPVQREAVITGLLAYGETDLLCYRAEWPQALVARQAQAWDPILDWARAELGADLRTIAGVMPVVQSDAAIAALERAVRALDDFALTALNQIASLTASLLLCLAIERGRLDAEAAWRTAQVDEDWQTAQWGEDAAARQRREAQRADMTAAARFLSLARAQS